MPSSGLRSLCGRLRAFIRLSGVGTAVTAPNRHAVRVTACLMSTLFRSAFVGGISTTIREASDNYI